MVLQVVSCLAGEYYITPRLSLSAGFDSNRMRVENDKEGSAFFEAAPGLALLFIPAADLELKADVSYAPRVFAGSEKGNQSTADGGIGAVWRHQSFVYEVWAGGGVYRDSEIPNDDVRWLYVAPSAGWLYTEGRQVYGRINLSHSRYDSRQTYEGEDEKGTFFSGVAGWYTVLGEQADLWIEGYYENFSANEPVDEYYTIGAATGIGRRVNETGRVDVGLRYGYQTYPNDSSGITEHEAHPVRVSAQYAHRLSDWASLELLARWERLPTSDVSGEYEQWLAAAGIVLSWELYDL
jgi:hypothetical protein